MNPFRKHVEELVEKANALHSSERIVSLASVDLVGELDRRNAAGYLLLSSTTLARRIGLSPNQYWKRLQVARLLTFFPSLRELVLTGATTVSNLGIISPHVTQANLSIFLAELPGKSQLQVAKLISTIAPSGTRRTTPLTDQSALLEQALTVAQAHGRRLTKDQLLSEALRMWLGSLPSPL